MIATLFWRGAMMDPRQKFERAIASERAGRLEEAVKLCQEVLQAQPANLEALQLLGITFIRLGRGAEAAGMFRQALQHAPSAPQLHNNLAEALRLIGERDEPEREYRRTLQLKPDHVAAMNNLATLLLESRREAEAMELLQRALQIKPDYAKAHYNLGNLLFQTDRLDEAIAAYQRAIALSPNYAMALRNLGKALAKRGQLEEAIGVNRRAIQIEPQDPRAHIEIVAALHHMGRTTESNDYARKAIGVVPDATNIHSALLMHLHYQHGNDGAMMFKEHCSWAQRYADALAPAHPPPRRDGAARRRIRIGYCSPDFKLHPVTRLAEPLLKFRDRDRFEIICYSDVQREDDVTRRLKTQVDGWHDITAASDVSVAELVRGDGIDILFDMAGHTAKRMLLFARKPAPVQVTHFGYPNTTGLRTMDWRITDAIADPPGMTETFYTEQLMRLDGCAWSYEPDDDVPDPGVLPADQAGTITFASMNNAVKVTPEMIALWAQILRAAARSRLTLLTWSSNYDNRDRIVNEFARHGIEQERLGLFPRASRTRYLAQHQQVDICLDAYPYNGGATTLDALWMGVPVVTLAGPTHVCRVGASIMTNVGLPDLVATSRDDYVRIAADLAEDLPRLRTLRGGLRWQALQSVMNGADYTRRMEAAFERMLR